MATRGEWAERVERWELSGLSAEPRSSRAPSDDTFVHSWTAARRFKTFRRTRWSLGADSGLVALDAHYRAIGRIESMNNAGDPAPGPRLSRSRAPVRQTSLRAAEPGPNTDRHDTILYLRNAGPLHAAARHLGPNFYEELTTEHSST